jgi:hypothetical protein
MTDYIQDLREALRQAAAREYPTLDLTHQHAPTDARGRRFQRLERRELIHRPPEAPRVRRRRRAALRIAALACAVAAAVFVVANIASTGNRSAVPQAQAQTILRHVRAALVFPPHAIYEEETVNKVTARDGRTHTSGWHEWLSTSPPYNGRIIEIANGKVLWEQSFVNRRMDLYDPATNTVYLAPRARTTHPRRARRHQTADTPQSTSALSEVRYLLNQSPARVKITSSTVLNGKPAIKLTFDGGRFSYWISPRTYQPLQSEDRQDSLPDGQHGVGITRYPIVRVLTGSAASPSLLSLQAQHPGAKVDHSRTDYAAALWRLVHVRGPL